MADHLFQVACLLIHTQLPVGAGAPRRDHERVLGLALAAEHGRILGVGGIRHNVALQGELVRLGARFVIAGTDTNYVLAGAKADTSALRQIPLN